MKPNKGGFAIESIGKGADNIMTHRLVWFCEIREDLWEGINIEEKAPLWWAQMSNYVEEWGEEYSRRVLSEQSGTNKDYKRTHFWDFKIEDPIQFKTVHYKIVKKFKKEFEGRWVAFGTYDTNYPGGSTHWVGVSVKNDNDHIMLYDKLQNLTEFIKLVTDRGKMEYVKDYMLNEIKTY